MTLTRILPDLDPATVEDLTPACEIRHDVISGVNVLTWGPTAAGMPCERPAEWIVRAHCGRCGQLTLVLMCEVHREWATHPDRVWVCDCKSTEGCSITWERL